MRAWSSSSGKLLWCAWTVRTPTLESHVKPEVKIVELVIDNPLLFIIFFSSAQKWTTRYVYISLGKLTGVTVWYSMNAFLIFSHFDEQKPF